MRKNKNTASLSIELTDKAARVIERLKKRTKIPKKYLVEEAVVEYLSPKYEKQEV